MNRSICIVLLLALVGLVFARGVGGGFLKWDDHGMVAANPLLNPVTPDHLKQMWTGPVQGLYTPLSYTLWSAVAGIARSPSPDATGYMLSAWPFHLLNVLLHAGATVLAYALLHRLCRSNVAALIGAAVFALHPLQVEPVAWIAGMNNVLAGGLALSAMYAYLRGRSTDADAPRWNRWLTAALMLQLLALLSKPTSIVLPAMLLVLDWLILQSPWRSAAARIWPFAALVLPFVLIGRFAQPADAVAAPPPVDRLIVAVDSVGFYLSQWIKPWPLLMDYGRPPAMVLQTGVPIMHWVILLAAAGLSIATFRRRPWIAGGLLMLVCGVGPVLGLVPFDFQQYSTVADRYAYLGLIGPAIALSLWLTERPAMPVRIAAAMVIVGWAAISGWQVGVWRNDFTLAEHALRYQPRSLGAHVTLSYAYAERGDSGRAVHHAQEALTLSPGFTDMHMQIAPVRLAQGQFAEAARHYQAAIDHGFADPQAYTGLAMARLREDKPEQALAAASAVLAVRPDHEQARITLGYAQGALGQLDAAEASFRRVLANNPNSVAAQHGLALIRSAKPQGAAP